LLIFGGGDAGATSRPECGKFGVGEFQFLRLSKKGDVTWI
jgi:hypothetical protein